MPRTIAVCIRVTVIISLTIAAVTAVIATILYAVVFGQQTSETPTPVHGLGDDRPVVNTRAVSEERLFPENRSAVEYLTPSRRSMNGRPWTSTGIRLPLTEGGIHGMLGTSRNRYPNNHRYGGSDGDVASPEKYDETGVTFDAETQQNTNRQINHIDYSNLETDNRRNEKGGSTEYHDSLDLTYNMGTYNNNQNDDLAGINELPKDPGVELDPYYTTIYGPYPNRPPVSQPTMDQSLSTDYKLPTKNYQPPTTNYQLPNMNYYQPTNMIYQPSNYGPPKITAPQKPILESPQQKIETPISNTSSVVDWRLIGILSLIKLGIVKLKSIAIIKLLLFLVFSLKLLLIPVSFKLLLLFKFFKVMIVPFLFVPLLLTSLIFPLVLSSLFTIPGRLIRFLFTPNSSTNQPSNMTPSVPAMMPSIPSNMLPIIPSNMPSTPGNIRPGFVPFVPRPGSLNPPAAGIATQPANTPGMPTVARHLDYFPSNKNETPSTKSDTSHLPYGWHSEYLEASYPIVDVFWKIIDSEKCVERIACRMAATEEAGTMPIWINWAMRGVSKLIPNKKLELFYKTYDNIKNEVLTNPPMKTPDSWNLWCLEHYN